MNFETQYNIKSPAVKRLMREASEMHEPSEDYSAIPVSDNLFEWHFTIKGAPETDFEGGVYHGRILFPSEYPMKPPNIVLLTPNGRFETNKKICLSISGHHPETWQPSWCVRTALLALIAFMPTPGSGTVGALDYSPEERKALAKKSQEWRCSECGKISDLLKKPENQNTNSTTEDDTKEPVQTTSNAENLEQDEKILDEYVFIPEPEIPIETSPIEISDINTNNNDLNAASSTEPIPSRENVNIPQPDNASSKSAVSSGFSNLMKSDLIISVLTLMIAMLIFRRVFLLDSE